MTVVERDGHRVEVTNPDKPMWPGISKGDLVDYYVRVAEHLLPHVDARPLTLVRCPDGIDGNRWYQKDAAGAVPEWVRTAPIRGYEDDDVHHAVAATAADLAALGQLASLELHAGPATVDDPDHPREMILDLDPPGRRDDEVRWAARQVRRLLDDELGLATGVKTSGSKGFHLHVPLDGSADLDEVRGTARGICELLAARHPGRLTVEQRKDRREDRVFLDWLRNHPAQTAVAAYSPRALPGAPVATPLDWDELSEGVTPDRYAIGSVFRRLGQRDDPWAGLRDHAQSLTEATRRLKELAHADG